MSDVIGVEGAGDADTRLEWTAVLAFQPRPLVLANRAAAAVLERTHASRGPSAVLEPPPPPPMLADRPAVAPASKLQCPCCGDSKVLSKSFGQKGITVVISADRYFAGHFERAGVKCETHGGSFKVCAVCYRLALAAYAKAIALFPSCITFADAVSSSKAARVLPYRIICGGALLVITCVALHISYN